MPAHTSLGDVSIARPHDSHVVGSLVVGRDRLSPVLMGETAPQSSTTGTLVILDAPLCGFLTDDTRPDAQVQILPTDDPRVVQVIGVVDRIRFGSILAVQTSRYVVESRVGNLVTLLSNYRHVDAVSAAVPATVYPGRTVVNDRQVSLLINRVVM